VNGRRGNAVALTLRLGLPGFRYVTTVHGILGLHSRRNAVYRVVDLAAGRLATSVIAVSEHGRRALVAARSPRDRTVTIANGLADRELQALRAVAAARRGAGRGGLPARVGFLGRLSPEKGTKELLELAPVLAASGSGATLDIAGDGPDRDWLVATMAGVAAESTVRWRGTVADSAAFLRDVDILVLPSHNEGMPYVVLEGMAAGCAVVAFAVGGIPEVIGSGDLGVLVDPGDVAAFVAEVTALAGDPDRVATIGRAASEHIERRFALTARLPLLQQAYGLAAPTDGTAVGGGREATAP
jgi:glycosyltransferase involved in cell wall biosynthesis